MTTPYKLLEKFNNQIETSSLIVEIGSARDGGSTYFLSELARATNNEFVTVDVDPIFLNPRIKSETMSGETWATTKLPSLEKKISVAFIDSYDWIDSPVMVRSGGASSETYNLITEYASKGMNLNNLESAATITKQVILMLPYMKPRCIVMLPKTWFNYTSDSFTGKGAGAAYTLLAEGFKIISASHKDNYLLLGRNVQPIEELPSLNIGSLSTVYTGPKKRADEIIYN